MSARREFPVLARLIDTCQESLALLVLRKVEEDFDHPGPVAMQVLLQIHDGAIALVPDGFFVAQLGGSPWLRRSLRMHANYQHFLIVRAIEDADPSALGKTAMLVRQRKSCFSSSGSAA